MTKFRTNLDDKNLKKLSEFLLANKRKYKHRYRNIAAKAGIARCTTSKVINGKTDVNFTTLLKLLDVMGIEVQFKEKLK